MNQGYVHVCVCSFVSTTQGCEDKKIPQMRTGVGVGIWLTDWNMD